MAGNSNSGRKATKETMETVFIKLPTAVLLECKSAAKADGRTMSSYLRKIISDAHAPR